METEKKPKFKHKKYARQIVNQLNGISYVAKLIKTITQCEDPEGKFCKEYQEARRLLKGLYKNAQRGYGVIIQEKHLPITMRKQAVIFQHHRPFKSQIIGYLSSRGVKYDYATDLFDIVIDLGVNLK